MATTPNTFDVIFVGAGPGGYVGAIRAAQLGLNVAVVEKNPTLGGTCLNVGCIPSKALLSASEKYHAAGHEFAQFGIDVAKPKLNLKQMMAFKDQVVADNTKGIAFLFKKNKITHLVGLGEITSANTLKVGTESYTAKLAIVVATGSTPIELPNIKIDEKQIVTSTGALTLATVPKTMVVIGAGVIGLEMASVWQRLGAQVTVVEFLDRILPEADTEMAKTMQNILSKQGLTFKLGHKVTNAKAGKNGVEVTLEPSAGGAPETMQADVVLVAIGRRAYTDNLGLDKVGVQRDNRGRVIVDNTFMSNIDGIYAIGDVIHGPMLAHKAEEDGVALAEILAGQHGHVDYNLVPGVVYTNPEMASIGQTEEQLKTAGVDYRVGKFPFMANGRARAMGVPDGLVKILAHAKTDKVLGAHIVGYEAGGLIHEVAVLMSFGGSAEDLARICHAHPTLNEAVKEAALAACGMGAVHI
jgi:dihydrolipoamide dehydrogenase